MKKWIVVLMLGLLAACGSRMSGTYTDTSGLMTVEFSWTGKAKVHVAGKVQSAKYVRKGDTLELTGEDGTVFHRTVREDGTIDSLFGPLIPCEEGDPRCPR